LPQNYDFTIVFLSKSFQNNATFEIRLNPYYGGNRVGYFNNI
jgi:hypothetical protein